MKVSGKSFLIRKKPSLMKQLGSVYRSFAKTGGEIPQQAEKVFFPAIKEAQQNGTTQAKNIILSQLKDMREEHDLIGRSMDEINVLSNAYELPADACKTYMVAFKMLEEFEDDLHVHVHLENNILFPKAEKLAV